MPNYQSEVKVANHKANVYRNMDQKLYFKSIESMSMVTKGGDKNDDPPVASEVYSRKSKRVTRKISRDTKRSGLTHDKNRRRELENAGIGSLKR